MKINAQLPSLSWARSVGTGTAYESGNSVTTDASGNVYITGVFRSNGCDFDPGPATFNLSSYGNSDIFILKLDASGNFVWAGSIGSAGIDVACGIVTDGAGNMYISGSSNIVGWSNTPFDFDPGPGTYTLNSPDAGFIIKLNPSGNLIWTKTYTGLSFGSSAPFTLNVDATGNIYTGGYYGGLVDFDPGPSTYTLTYGSANSFISKLDPSGNFLWAKSIDGSNNSAVKSLTFDPSGNIYTAGYFAISADFDPGPGTYSLTSAGDLDIFISKFDQNGNFVWAKRIGDSGPDRAFSIALDVSNNIYYTGSYSLTVDFDPGAGVSNLISAGGSDIFISKLDSAGNFAWAKSQSGTYDESGNGIVLDAVGNIYNCGNFSGTVDFDPGPSSYTISASTIPGYTSGYISKLDSLGNFQWAMSLAGSTQGNAADVTVDGIGNVYSTGTFEGMVDFDPGPGTYTFVAPGGYNDMFVLKLSQAPLALGNNIIIKNSYSVFPNPTSGILNLELNAGCDVVFANVLGQTILEEKKDKGKHTINLNDTPAGIYFVKFISDKGQETFKLVKE